MADIQNAIKQAREAAALIVDAEVTAVTLPATQGQSAVTLSTGKRSMAAAGVSGGISNKVNGWLKIGKTGFSIDKDLGVFDDIEVLINMTEDTGFYVKDTIKWGDNPVNYASCYTGDVSDKGQPWGETVARALRVDAKCQGFYPAVDLILTTTKQITLKEKGKFIEAGTKLGFTSAKTHWRNWNSFYDEVAAAGELGTTLRINMHHTAVTKNGNTWGVPEFSIIEDDGE